MATRIEQDYQDDEVGGTELVTMPSDGMVDMQIATAKRYPRSVSRFRKEAEALALLDEETAAECIYALPRDGKVIEGPSARFAEILMFAWGNARAEAEVIDEGQTHLTARGTFFDMERNVAVRKTIKRRITNKRGVRYNEDMIAVTGNAANSIAMRNAVFAGIPKAIWKPIYEKARYASLGQGGTLTQKRQQMVEWFGKLAVTPEQVCALVGVDGIEDVKEDQLITLRGFANAIKDGELKVEDLLAGGDVRAAGAAPAGDLNARVRQKAAANGNGAKKAPKEESATPKQDELIRKMIKSHVITDEERNQIIAKLDEGKMSKSHAGDCIDWLTQTIDERKAEEKRAAEEAGAEEEAV